MFIYFRTFCLVVIILITFSLLVFFCIFFLTLFLTFYVLQKYFIASVAVTTATIPKPKHVFHTCFVCLTITVYSRSEPLRNNERSTNYERHTATVDRAGSRGTRIYYVV